MNKRVCDNCGCRGRRFTLAPMLYDEVWLAIAGEHELLCIPCCRQRMQTRLGRDLAFEDLLPCPFNLFGGREVLFEELAPPELKAAELP